MKFGAATVHLSLLKPINLEREQPLHPFHTEITSILHPLAVLQLSLL